MANIGARYCYFKIPNQQIGINLPISNLSVKEKIIQLSGLNQNKRILAGYDISISTPILISNLTNVLGDLYWTSDEINNENDKRIACFKIKDIVFLFPDLQYQSKSESIDVSTYTLNGTSNTTDPIQKIFVASEIEAKEKNLEGW